MSAKRRNPRGAPKERGPAAAFFVELALVAVALPGFALGLLIIAVMFSVALSAEGWWQPVVGFAVATVVSLVGLFLGMSVTAVVLFPISNGWLGMLSGRRPREFAEGQRNGARALADLFAAATLAPLGVMLYRHGVTEGESNWAVEGLFLTAGAALVGLGGAVPRLYFAASAKRPRPEAGEGDDVIRFVMAAMLGVGVSLGISMAFHEARPPDEAMRADVWHVRCLSETAHAQCRPAVTLSLTAERAGLYALDTRGECDPRPTLTRGDGRAPHVLSEREQQTAGVASYDAEAQLRTQVLRLAAGEPIRATYSRRPSASGCVFRVRYRHIDEGKR